MSIASDRPFINQEIPPHWPPSQVQQFATTAHKTQGKLHLHLLVYSIIKDVIKERDEQPDEEVHKARSKSVPRAGTPGLVELGCITWMCSPTWKRACEELLWMLHHVVIINYWLNLQPSLLPRGEVGWKFQPSYYAWSFWWAAPSWSYSIITSLEQERLLSPRKFQEI